ncbi:unnamed protein product [Alternaria alternata]
MDDIPDELLLHIVGQLRGPTSWTEPADDDDLTLGSWGCRPNTPGAMPPFLTDENDSIVYNVPWRWPIPSSPISKLSLIRPYVSENMVKKLYNSLNAPFLRPIVLGIAGSAALFLR